MSRREDLASAEKRIQGFQDKIKEVHAQYQQYSEDVVASIKGLLVDAGLYDQIHALEVERAETAKAAQDKINSIQQEIAKAAAARDFLLSLGQESSEISEIKDAGEPVIEIPEDDPMSVPDKTKVFPIEKNKAPTPSPKKPAPPKF